MEAFIGTVLLMANNYAPRGWMLCQGQELPISQYSAVFSLLGTTYGGNGTTTFKLPDLRGRVAVGTGSGPGLSTRVEGQVGGAESFTAVATLTGVATIGVNNLPSHTHAASGALTASTAVRVGTAAVGVAVPVDGSGLTVSPGGPTNAGIYTSPAPTSGTVILGNVATTIGGNVDATGGGAPAPVAVSGAVMSATMPPFLALNYCICLEGIFPSRN